jgi:alkylhydroperoxidase family enzyme
MIDEDKADGELKALYGRLTEPWGGVDNILKIHSLNPASLRGHFEFYKTLMRGRSPLDRTRREMIAVVVSAANRCHY